MKACEEMGVTFVKTDLRNCCYVVTCLSFNQAKELQERVPSIVVGVELVEEKAQEEEDGYLVGDPLDGIVIFPPPSQKPSLDQVKERQIISTLVELFEEKEQELKSYPIEDFLGDIIGWAPSPPTTIRKQEEK